jgi:DNA methylase
MAERSSKRTGVSDGNRAKVNPKILRTGFLSKRGKAPESSALLGQTVAVALSDRTVKARAVESLPRTPRHNATYILLNDKHRGTRSMHNLVRFPAKLHTPFVAWAINRYTRPGEIVLDPFCGCGTVVLEATLRGRQAVGFDVDPYSAVIARAKACPPTPRAFEKAAAGVATSLQSVRRHGAVYDRLAKGDISEGYFRKQLQSLNELSLPRADHWFKRYVLVDLLRIRKRLLRRRDDPRVARFLVTSFASILRLCSNADPDTLSGLEVTSRMREWMKRGRRINPVDMFLQRLKRNGDPILADYWARYERSASHYRPVVRTCSALDGRSYRGTRGKVSAIITSPPYCSAVEYYRRHLLEHYWLDFIGDEEQGAHLRRRYIGRRTYVYGDIGPLLKKLPVDVARRLRHHLNGGGSAEADRLTGQRLRAIVKYFIEMHSWFRLACDQLKAGGHLVLVVGDSTVQGRPVHTSKLLADLAPTELQLQRRFSYLLRNRSMQYSRWNQADVAMEHVLVFVKRRTRA